MNETRSRVIEANGLAFEIDEAGDGDDVALLLHGFPESRRSWSAQLPALAALGWRAVAPNLRGYGGSSRPKARSAYALEHLIADVGSLFDALGARRRLLIGHDWGGIIAWAFAAEQARPLDGLVIINAPHPGAYLDLVQRSPGQMLRSWYVAFFQIPWLPEVLTTAFDARAVRSAFRGAGADGFSRDELDHLARAAQAPGAMTAMINYYRANAAGLARWSAARRAPIAAPILVIWGEQDPFLGVGLAEASRGFGPDVAVERLPGVGHWAAQQDAAGVNARLAAWMDAKGLAARQA